MTAKIEMQIDGKWHELGGVVSSSFVPDNNPGHLETVIPVTRNHIGETTYYGRVTSFGEHYLDILRQFNEARDKAIAMAIDYIEAQGYGIGHA